MIRPQFETSEVMDKNLQEMVDVGFTKNFIDSLRNALVWLCFVFEAFKNGYNIATIKDGVIIEEVNLFENSKSGGEDKKEEASDELFEKLKKIMDGILDVHYSKIVPEARLKEDLGMDSLDGYELLYNIDSEMGVEISEEEGAKMKTVKDILDFIRKDLAE